MYEEDTATQIYVIIQPSIGHTNMWVDILITWTHSYDQLDLFIIVYKTSYVTGSAKPDIIQAKKVLNKMDVKKKKLLNTFCEGGI